MENQRTISAQVRRRYILGRQGLWPGRRWRGKQGTAEAMRTVEALQIDPVSVVAQSHDIVLWGRVEDYRPQYVHELAYEERKFFDYGSHLHFYPMEELPYWRVVMKRQHLSERWREFAARNQELIEEVRRMIRERGPLRNRDIDGKRVENYRAGKDTGVALYLLWVTGELMTHRRDGKERVHDFLENVAPERYQVTASEAEAAERLLRKGITQRSLVDVRDIRAILRDIAGTGPAPGEAEAHLARMVEAGELRSARLEGSGGEVYYAAADEGIVEALAEGELPDAWRPVAPTTSEEIVLLSPLDFVSARGRARALFDFDYTWEIYKPDHLRSYGPYTLPVLYGDRLVARVDLRHDRPRNLLILNGLWLESWLDPDAAFAEAFSRGLRRFEAFLGADGIEQADGAPPVPAPLRGYLRPSQG